MNEIVWAPTLERQQSSQMAAFQKILMNRGHMLVDDTYHALHAWSVKHIREFWQIFWEESGIIVHEKESRTMGKALMPGTQWFEGATLNFAENLLQGKGSQVALVGANEQGVQTRMTFDELRQEAGRIQQGLKELGVVKGDRVVAFMPNTIEAVVAMLAATGLGAVWSSCSPDFGFQGVMDRFGQIQPKVLFAPSKVQYNGKVIDTMDKVIKLSESLNELKQVVVCGDKERLPDSFISFDDFGSRAKLEYVPVSFDHPLYIMFSSGTTGIPKCIVHSVGGTLLAHLKEHKLHSDVRPGNVMFFYTTCGWMMWNWLVSGLASQAIVVLYDGSPLVPDEGVLFRLIDELRITHFGISPKYISSVMKSGYSPKEEHKMESLQTIFSTGAPLLPEHFLWVYDQWKRDVQLASISGGTDLIGSFMMGNPLMPVRVGEIQAAGLGLDVQCFNESGEALLGEKGELVCVQPFPNMPIGFWNDPEGTKYHDAYFDRFEGVWWHGDYVEYKETGGFVVYGRSDATLNPGGIRIGTAEIYRQAESLEFVKDSLVIGFPKDGDVEIILYVALDGDLTEERIQQIKQTIRHGATARHVPSRIFQVPEIPRTLSGKKVEKAVRNKIMGLTVSNVDAIANAEVLDAFVALS